MSDKNRRSQYGRDGQPIVATEVYVRPMDFDHKNVNAQSWILITPEGTMIQANSYDGRLGRNFSASDFTYTKPTGKDWDKKIKTYTKVQISDCPFAIQAPNPAPVEAPAPEPTPAQ